MKRVREKAPLAIPQVSFKGKERKKLPKRKKNEKGSRKNSFWQFLRSILKAQERKIAKAQKQSKKQTKRVREKASGGNSQGPRTIFEAKERKMKMPKGGKTGMKK